MGDCMGKKYTYGEVIELMHTKGVQAMEEACTLLEADTKLLTHVDSGDLRRSWTHSVTTQGAGVIGKVGTNLEYAEVENWRHPNLSKAVDNDKTEITKIFQKVMSDL